MLFLALLRDKSGHLTTRLENRAAHLDWIKASNGAVKVAGPYLDDEANEMRGSLLVVEAETLSGAHALLATDPYALAGLFASTEVHPWRWVIGAPTV